PPVSLDLLPLLESGRIVGAVGTVEDWTARERVERQYRLLEAVVLNAHDAMVITQSDPNGPASRRIVFVNPAFTRITDYASAEALGKRLSLLPSPPAASRSSDEIQKALIKEVPIQVELIDQTADPPEYSACVSILPVRDRLGKLHHFLGFQSPVGDPPPLQGVTARTINVTRQPARDRLLPDPFPRPDAP